MDRAVAIVLAAGSGERLGGEVPKAFVELGGAPMLVRAARAAMGCPGIEAVVVAAPPGFEDLAHAMIEQVGSHSVVTGGTTRQGSVRAALAAVSEDVPLVAVHDAARPFATSELFSAVLSALGELPDVAGSAPVIPVPDTVKRIDGGFLVTVGPRSELALAQTPQAFRAPALRDAHARAQAAGLDFTDDAAVLEWAGYRVKAVIGEKDNFKITTREDLELARQLVKDLSRG